MKALELTKEHKSQLLEMCEVLFPDWHEHCVETDGNSNIIVMFTNYVQGSEWGQVIFHWYEFCMTHILHKVLLEPNGYESIEDYISSNGYFMFGHPVDYLYKKFKKLNLN